MKYCVKGEEVAENSQSQELPALVPHGYNDYSDNDDDDDDAATNDKAFYDERTERTMNATDVSFFAFFLSGVSDMSAHTHTHTHTYKPHIEDSYDDNPGLMDEEEALNEAQDDGTGFVVVDYSTVSLQESATTILTQRLGVWSI
jgi:hypothetical protein